MQDIDEIEEGLFLSSRGVAQTEAILASNGITHILTVDTWPLHEHFTLSKKYVLRFLCKNDEENVDLLSHFEECNGFIRSGDKVLVHCYMGISRSATIVLAYLMNKHRMSYEDALIRVSAKRRVAPNDGFVEQLKLYQRMGFTIDLENLGYRLLYLTSIVPQVGSHLGVGNLPAEDQRRVNSLLAMSGDLDVLCRHCRHPLASSDQVIHHNYQENVTWSTISKNRTRNADARNKHECSEEFVLPSGKIMAQCPGVAGKIYCPKCTNKVGRFAWLGVHCDCGSEMQPGFVLSLSKIDRRNPTISLGLSDLEET